MKKRLSVLLIIVFVLSTFCITSNATEENREDSENIREVFINSTFKEKTEEGYYVFTSEASPITAYSLYSNDSTVPKTKAQSTIIIVPSDEADTELWDSITNDTIRSSGGNKYAYAWDSTGGVKIFSTIYYTESTSGGREYTKLTSCARR